LHRNLQRRHHGGRHLLGRADACRVPRRRRSSAWTEASRRYRLPAWIALPTSMATLAKLALPYAHRFEALLQVAEPVDLPLVRFMVDHELSVSRIAEREAAGEPAMANELIVKLAHPIAR
jgi:hypothetical protein